MVRSINDVGGAGFEDDGVRASGETRARSWRKRSVGLLGEARRGRIEYAKYHKVLVYFVLTTA